MWCLAIVLTIRNPCCSNSRATSNSILFLSTILVHWNVARDCCSWEGVTCSNESFSKGHVIGLNLNIESIYVGLDYSSSFFSLQHLQDLSLAYNNFNNSQIPPRFGNLMNLSYLNLSNAGFAGLIPIEISNLKRLVTLDLSTSPFLSVSMLKIENPDLATLVQNFGELKELYLDGVNISASGNEWCQALYSSVPNLRVLSMSNCYLLGSLDSSLLKLQSLSIIRLDNNPFNAPEFFANFTNLASLDLRYCGLNGTFPEKIFQVPRLQTLDLSNNELLQGSLPKFLPNGSLRSLLLSGKNFSGALPDSIGNLQRLSNIDLSKCHFNGSIPNSMANLTQLIYLDMSYNEFNGQIPSFSISKNLTEINLSFNDLGGSINSIEGSIPMSLFSHPSIQKLQLLNNKFSGGLQEFNVSSYPLDHLDLSNNNLEGPLPASVFKLQGLNFLSSSFNNFSGSFQLDGIQKLRNLSKLDPSYKKLSINYNGTASPLLFPYFTTFKLASCNLGKFPDFLRNQSKLYTLDLSHNQIHGEIPKSLANCTNLEVLDIGNNHIEDVFPYYLRKISRLRVLVLRSNNFHGSIGCDGTNVTWPMLQIIDLALNNFTGQLPRKSSSTWKASNLLRFLKIPMKGTKDY